jgi:hypothetical protein
MSERIELHSGEEIRDWAKRNGFDVVDLDPGAPRFFQPMFTPVAGPMLLFSVEHTYLTNQGFPMVSVKRTFRATSAEDALIQYLREPKDRSAGQGEHSVGFIAHTKPGSGDREAIIVSKAPGE